MGAEIDSLKDENDVLKKSIDEIKGSEISIEKALGRPVTRQTAVVKSIWKGGIAAPT